MQEISPLYQSYDGYGYLRQERINQRVEEPSDVEHPRRREPAQNGDAGDAEFIGWQRIVSHAI